MKTEEYSFTLDYEELEQLLLDYLYEIGELSEDLIIRGSVDIPVSLDNNGQVQIDVTIVPLPDPELPF
jgi:hypothetical protein